MSGSERLLDIPAAHCEIAGNLPLFMTDPGKVWIVHSGYVDVFTVRTGLHCVAGSRSHLFRAGKGSALFGVRPCGDFGLLAVGGGKAGLLETNLAELIQFSENTGNEDAFFRLLSGWIESLSTGIGTTKMPKTIEFLEIGSETSLIAGVDYSVRERMLWVHIPEAVASYLGERDWPDIPTGTFFPLLKRTWLKSSKEVTARGLATRDLIDAKRLSPSLDSFHAFMLTCIVAGREKIEKREQERHQRKKLSDETTMSQALSGLLSILEKKEYCDTAALHADRPLVSACSIVAEALGIKMGTGRTVNSDSLDGIARDNGFRVREVLLRDGWWRQDNGALLAFLKKDNGPVALTPNFPTRYQMVNPADGSTAKVTSAVAEIIAPKAYAFYRPFAEKSLSGKDLLKFGLRGTLRDNATVLAMGIGSALLGLLIPILTGFIFDTLIPEAARGRLLQIAVIFIALSVSVALFEITKSIAVLRIEGKMDGAVQAALWDRLLALPVRFFRNYSAGDLAVRSMGIHAMRSILSGVTVSAVLGCIFSSFNLLLLFYYSTELALVALALTSVISLVGLVVGYLQVRVQNSVLEIEGENSGIVLQFITGISKLRISGTEDRAFARWAGNFGRKKRLAYKSGSIENIRKTFDSLFPVLASMVFFAWIGFKGMDNMTTGGFIAFMAAFGSFQNTQLQLFTSLTSLINIVPLYRRAKPILTCLPESDENKTVPDELTGDIEVTGVNFRYDEKGPLVLKDVSLRIAPGEFVAIVGGSGSGKSTLLRLLLGFESSESGSIYYDGQDLGSLNIREVRRNIGVVLQNGTLMPGDIFKNIVGVSNLTLKDAWEAARMVGIEEEIREMPMGMHTMVPPGGATLSGGQRQRLLIARALVNKPRILFFDEATSALDNKTQATVSWSLEQMKSARVVIAHRLSTVMNADRIYVLKKGEIVESGTYPELKDKNGFFAELARRQIA